MQISGVSLALTWPHRLCLLRVLLCMTLAMSFPLSKHTGECDTALAFSGLRVYLQFMWEVGLPPLLCSFPLTSTFTSFPAPDYWAILLLLPAAMFVYSSCGKWVFPSLLWSFPPSSTLTSFPTPGCWVPVPAPTGASLACLACLFTVPGRIPFPQSLALSVPHPLCHVSLLFLLLITQFLFFPWVEVSLSRGLCCFGPRLSVGVLQYHEAHLVRVFPSRLGVGDWRPGGPPCFSV
jgi:hypothetical protein